MTLWRVAFGVLAVSAFIIVRGCGYEFGTVGAYLAYLVFHVAIPGVVTMYAVSRRPVSVSHAFALGLPTGFALEIFTYLGLSALGMKEAYAWVPLGWGGLAMAIRYKKGEWPVRSFVSAHHAGCFLGLCVVFLAAILMAASQMFSESPLADGLPTRAIFHDWVYLVSRAAVIKHNWPLDDPSLAGTPLQYHYFMMVHAAAVSWTTDIELTAVMLRLLYVPLGAVLVMQACVLGRAVSRNPWGGVLAALLTVAASEMSFARSYGEPMFLGLFVRWLFVSPTFFFGMIFCGALLIAIAQCTRLQRCDARHYVWLLLLGTAGTGAKGTVIPALVGALGLWTAWQWVRERRLPVRPILFAVCLSVAFFIVYIPTMSDWRTGDATLRPFHAFQLASFWKDYLPGWQEWFTAWLPIKVAVPLATIACALVVFIGTCGVRLLAIPYLLWGDGEKRDSRLVIWIGAFFFTSLGMGVLMELNSYGELYLFLMTRLPMAVLAAAFFVSAWRRHTAWRSKPNAVASDEVRDRRTGGMLPARWARRIGTGGTVAVFATALGVQTSLWWARNSKGLREFLTTPADLRPDGYMQELREALLWVRNNTESNAVLVANSCTPENMKKDHWGALDRTLTGVHFYYSAISERRMWFEGPNYILDTTRARSRASLASDFFYRGEPLDSEIVGDDPTYVLLDRSLADGAEVTLPLGHRVFANRRMEIYRLSHEPGSEPERTIGGAAVAGTSPE
ncbi:MAG: hypothetical protein ACREH8_18720 [Opitutaceae bacterium]